MTNTTEIHKKDFDALKNYGMKIKNKKRIDSSFIRQIYFEGVKIIFEYFQKLDIKLFSFFLKFKSLLS